MTRASILFLFLLCACSLELADKRACVEKFDCNAGWSCMDSMCVKDAVDADGGDGDGGDGDGDAGPPTQGLESLTLWLKADVGAMREQGKPATDGDQVRIWLDQSPRRFDASQFYVDLRPTWSEAGGPNGGAALLFDGDDDHMTLGDNFIFSEKRGMFFFLVIKSETDVPWPREASDPIVLNFGAGANDDFCLMYDVNTIGMRAASILTEYYDHTFGQHGNWVLATYQVVFKDYMRVRINGEEEGSKGAPTVERITGAEISESHIREKYAGPVTIGGQSKTLDDDNRFLTGAIAEIRIYDDALTSADRNTVECELAATYGIKLRHACGPGVAEASLDLLY
jgi:hypothetical protein